MLILLKEFPDFLLKKSFSLIHELSSSFIQLKNILLSPAPKGLTIPSPYSDN